MMKFFKRNRNQVKGRNSVVSSSGESRSSSKDSNAACQNSLWASSAGRYFLYALGEIFLVLIGILIALQINHWKENQKDRRAQSTALVNLKQEFDENQKQLEVLLAGRQLQERQCRAYLDLITDEVIPISEKITASPPSTNGATWGATNTILNSLVSTGGIDRIQNDSLKFLLTNWPVFVDKFKIAKTRFIEAFSDWTHFENLFIPRSIVRDGDYRGKWPGNYFPPSIAKKWAPSEQN